MSQAVAGAGGSGDGGDRHFVPCVGFRFGCVCHRCQQRRRGEVEGPPRPPPAKRGRPALPRTNVPLRRGMMRGRISKPAEEPLDDAEKKWEKVVSKEWERVGGKGYMGSLDYEDFMELLRRVVQQRLRPSQAVEEARDKFFLQENYFERLNFETFYAFQHVQAAWEAYHGRLDRDEPVREPLDDDDEAFQFPPEDDDADDDNDDNDDE